MRLVINNMSSSCFCFLPSALLNSSLWPNLKVYVAKKSEEFGPEDVFLSCSFWFLKVSIDFYVGSAACYKYQKTNILNDSSSSLGNTSSCRCYEFKTMFSSAKRISSIDTISAFEADQVVQWTHQMWLADQLFGFCFVVIVMIVPFFKITQPIS